MSGKLKSLASMFAGFPSYRPSPGMLSETLKTYLTVLEIYSDDQVGEACLRLTREPREFPPTAGEVRAACEKIALAQTPPRPALTDETRPYDNDLTPEQRADNIRRFKELIAEIGSHKKEFISAGTAKVRAAPYNLGAPLVNSLVEKGLIKVKTEERSDVGLED